MRRLFKGYACLLETRSGRTNDVGQAPYGVGDNKDDERIDSRVEKGKDLPLLRHGQVAECENEAGNSQREHGNRVQNLSAGKACAHDNIGDCNAQRDVENRCEPRVFQTIFNRWQGQVMAERGVKMRKRPTGRQDRGVPIFREGDENNSDVRKDSQGCN